MASPADVRETGDDMFPAHLLTDNKSLLAALPEGYTMRPLSVIDYGNGFPEIFSVLTDVGDISKEAFEKRFREMQSIWGYYILVVLDGSKKIVGTGALVLEKKFIRGLATAGHIEDIAVAQDQQGKKLGLHIIKALTYLSEILGCYKAILDCDEHNEGFYQKCGYKHKGIQMGYYHE